MPVKLQVSNPSIRAWMLIRHTFFSIVKCEDELFTKKGFTSQQLAVLMDGFGRGAILGIIPKAIMAKAVVLIMMTVMAINTLLRLGRN